MFYFAGIILVCSTHLKEKGKDPDQDPDPYLWLMDPDPDPGVPKTCGSGSGSPTLDSCFVDLFFPLATGVNDTGGVPLAANISANFCKIRDGCNGILMGLGETD